MSSTTVGERESKKVCTILLSRSPFTGSLAPKNLQRVSPIYFPENPVVQSQAVQGPMVAGTVPRIEVLICRFKNPKCKPVHPCAESHVGCIDKPILVLFIELPNKSGNGSRLGVPGGYVRIQIGILVEQLSKAAQIIRTIGKVTGDENRFRMPLDRCAYRKFRPSLFTRVYVES